MKAQRHVITALMFMVAVTVGNSQVQAQDAGSSPLEAFYCSLRDGQSMDDLMQVASRFSKWADKNSPDYSAWILTRAFVQGDQLPQMIWLGSNPTGASMGKLFDAYQKTGGDLAAAFDKVVDCSGGHGLATSVEINAPDGPPGDGVVMFSQCSIADGSDWMKAVEAHKAFSGEMRSMGGKNSNWAFFPMLGGVAPDFDYWAVSTFNNWTDYFGAYDLYTNGEGWKKAMATFKGVTNCNKRPPTVWNVKLVRQGAN